MFPNGSISFENESGITAAADGTGLVIFLSTPNYSWILSVENAVAKIWIEAQGGLENVGYVIFWGSNQQWKLPKSEDLAITRFQLVRHLQYVVSVSLSCYNRSVLLAPDQTSIQREIEKSFQNSVTLYLILYLTRTKHRNS